MTDSIKGLGTSDVADLGVSYVWGAAARKKWKFRNQPINDNGLDAYMEIIDSTGESRQLLGLQIKSGPSYFKEKKDDCVIFRDISESHYNYWTKNPLPCILVLYNPEDGMCVWQKLTRETIERVKSEGKRGRLVKVPLSQVFLDDASNEQLLSFTNLPQYVTNYNFLLSQKVFMQIIQDGGEVKLHATEWIHKSSGRGDTELIVDDGKSIQTYAYPYWFPYTEYTDVFPRLFPWADFEADEDFFEDHDIALWRDLHCYYDKEDKEWLVVGDTFEEFRSKLDPMRSILHSGEVAEYMMRLKLNDLGKAFLSVDEFVSQNDQPYASARPEENKNEEN